MKQNVCMIAALALVLLAAGYIETVPAVSFAALAGVGVLIIAGRLGKKRVTCAGIERMCKDAKK